MNANTHTKHLHIVQPLHKDHSTSSLILNRSTSSPFDTLAIVLSRKINITCQSCDSPHTADHPSYINLTSTFTMTMTMDQRNNHLGGINFDHMQPYGGSPQFSNPWPSSQSASHAPQLFPSSMGNSNAGFEALKQQQSLRSTSSPMPYSSVPASAPSMTATNGYPSYATSNLLDMSQDLLKPEFPRSSYEQGYSAAPSSVSAYAPTSTPYVSSYSTLAQPQQPDEMRRLSHS